MNLYVSGWFDRINSVDWCSAYRYEHNQLDLRSQRKQRYHVMFVKDKCVLSIPSFENTKPAWNGKWPSSSFFVLMPKPNGFFIFRPLPDRLCLIGCCSSWGNESASDSDFCKPCATFKGKANRKIIDQFSAATSYLQTGAYRRKDSEVTRGEPLELSSFHSVKEPS